MFQSSLFDEKTFYKIFINDLLNCENEVIIESPFITSERMSILMPIFKDLVDKEKKIFVITRDPSEHSEPLQSQSEKAIVEFEVIGVQTFLCIGNHHRKLAIIDRKILWEGSLNILSQIKSREIMRRIENEDFALEMFGFLKLGRFI
jgi:phosphatidylserine/phosphatidylglycerophosphate/cardiolipin synthase-like enzyme